MSGVDPEKLVIGACMLASDAIRFASEVLAPDDFRSWNMAEVFRAIVQARKAGDVVEPFTVWTRATKAGVKDVQVTDLHEWMMLAGSAESTGFYAREVKELATRRRMSAAAARFAQNLASTEVPTAQTMSEMLEALKAIRDNSTDETIRALSLGEILDLPEAVEDWVIPGLLERGDRLVVTGYEGMGKTTWIRQLAICAAAGIHPTTLDHIKPVKGLVVDVENSVKQWQRQTSRMAATAAKHGGASPRENLHIHCQGRMDIRKDKDLGLVHRLVDEHQPEILCIGPIYKLSPTALKNDEEAAPVIAALDSLRDRGLVLIIEAHAPKMSNGQRDLAPRGSAALMGWPEFGFGLAPADDDQSMADVVRWRGDRETGRAWPKQMYRSGPFPWTGDTVQAQQRHKFLGMQSAVSF
ncbi:AAA family ATPase [Paenarthrobacter nicotinovorans]|uniref:AAA family ATPase n=1 Tax=Paenarthrobacter nicotinovorans TaxID=29320 RepID=UPI0037FDF010